MNMDRISRWANANRWLLALILFIAGGYVIGKDWALRDNARDIAATSEASS